MKNQVVSQEVQALMGQTRVTVAARLHKLFQEAPMMAAIGEVRAVRLARHTKHGGETLDCVLAEVRQAIVERRPENKLGWLGLWHVVDAICSLSTCSSDRWPYMTDNDRRTYLQWALEELDDAEKAVAHARAHVGASGHRAAVAA